MSNQQQQRQNIPNNPQGPKKAPKFSLSWVYLIIFAALMYMFLKEPSETKGGIQRNISYSEFKEYVGKGYAEKVVAYDDNKVELTIIADSAARIFGQSAVQQGAPVVLYVEVGSVEALDRFLDEQEKLGTFTGKLDYKTKDKTFSNLFWNLFPFILLVGVWVFIMRRMGGGGAGGPGGVFNVGKSKAQLFDKGSNSVRVTFKDVAGQAEAKQEVEEIVEFLKKPEKYTELGGKIPKGALLVGPPGTGKTLLAKAVAGEADVPFFSLSGSDFVEMFVGVGASRVRDLFRQAKEKAPCIIFIDEIDAIGRARGKNPAMGGNDERENTLNQLLTEMDGFGTNSGVIILAATNRVDILDKALLRAGRFDRQIHVDLPDLNERKEVFGVHLKPLKLDKSVDMDLLARQTPGFSGADIANVCNEAALIAARHNKKKVDKEDFLAAVDRIIGGLEKKTKVLTAEEKRTIALHEAGHATLSWHLQYADPLVKVTIVPRGRALGAAWYLPEERQITTKEQMLDEMCAILGGRAAEELFIGRISTGAMNDLERVTKQAYGMIAFAGMGDNLPNICYYNNQEQFQKPYSEKTAELIDNEVKALIAEQYERAKRMLMEYKEGHRELADLLMEREVIFAEDAERIFGKRAWASRSEEIMDAEPVKAAEPKKHKETKAVVTEAVVAEVAETVVEAEIAAEAPVEAPVAEPVEAPVEETPVAEAPAQTEAAEPAEPVAPKRTRKRKADDNLFGGFDFDQDNK
ncbi:MAG: ATP-dependent zinc metalloprotease FtsH [Bacteroidaceae bacterium]|nr:ATP-dependent zinc metalloprotease FtsH [Bacteroidaceae bacterium]